jgi:hypothetical protein
MDEETHDAERLLRNFRPAPRADFVRGLEAELLARTRKGDRFRVLAAGIALCATLAALTLGLSIAGLLPWTMGAGDRAKAGTDCVTTVVVRHERRPVLVVDADGAIRTENRIVAVRKPVKRCR